MINGLFSEDRALMSPIKQNNISNKIVLLDYTRIGKVRQLTKYKIVVLSDSLQEATVGAPI